MAKNGSYIYPAAAETNASAQRLPPRRCRVKQLGQEKEDTA